jgi:hypothetical protein
VLSGLHPGKFNTSGGGAPTMIDVQDLVTAYTVKTAEQAEIVKNFLHSEGIACRIDGEGQIGLAGIVDISLLVHAADADRARKLILQHEHVKRHSR